MVQGIFLTANDFPVFKWIVFGMGKIIEVIFNFLNSIGIPNIAIAIILFTVVIYLFLTPITWQQQKFAKLNVKMSPELKKVQEKYKGRRDQAGMQAMQAETNAIYKKYGVSPSGSCLQMLIQLPILIALYQVIGAMPAYVETIRNAFFPLVDKLIQAPGSAEFLQTLDSARYFAGQFTNQAFTSGNVTYVQNTYIDVLNKASSAEWTMIAEKFPQLSADVTASHTTLLQYNSFLGGLNIADSPMFTIQNAFAAGSFGLIIIAAMIPILAALTQWLNFKLMPQASGADSMQQQMKTMNAIMPLLSAYFCLSLPAGMGIYWIAAAVVRSIQQIILNKQIDKIDFDSIIKNNEEKLKNDAKYIKKKEAVDAARLQAVAQMSTKKGYKEKAALKAGVSDEEWDKLMKQKEEAYRNAPPGSITANANLVQKYKGE